MNDNLLGNNIRFLRKALGETGLELGQILGEKSGASLISMYESGKRKKISPENLRKLCEHFHVTEYELLHVDFSDVTNLVPNFKSYEDMRNFSNVVFPLVCSEESLKDSLFSEGYELNKKMINIKKNDCEELSDDDFIFIDLYERSYKNNKTIESIANLLSVYIRIESLCANFKYMSLLETYIDQNSSYGKEMIKELNLQSAIDDEADEELMEENLDNNSQIEMTDKIDKYLFILSEDGRYKDLAYYYMAIRYSNGCLGKELGPDGKVMGREMLYSCACLGNRYAINYIREMNTYLEVDT